MRIILIYTKIWISITPPTLPGLLAYVMSNDKALTIYADHQREVMQYADSIVRDTALAEDVVQEAFLRFQTAMQSEERANPVGYLYRIVRNLATDHLRINRRRAEIIEESAEQIWWPGQINELGPERHTLAQAESEYLRAVIATLPERCRRVFYLRRYESLTLAEIAKEMDLTVSIVRNDLKRAMHILTRARRRFHSGDSSTTTN